jgi:hypothetical protein
MQLSRSCNRSERMAEPYISHGMKTTTTIKVEERRGDAGSGADGCGKQPSDAEQKPRAPVVGAVDVAAGAEQEFAQLFYEILP